MMRKEINIINSEEGIARILTDVLLIDSFDNSFDSNDSSRRSSDHLYILSLTHNSL